MSDIFDEVDDILSEVDTETSEIEASDLAEKNFNESELQDIMAEIESLEKEFETDEVKASPLKPVKVAKQTDLQDEIDRELETSMASRDEKTSFEATPKVLSFEKKSPITSAPASTACSSSEISFAAHGQMNLNLDFKVGEETARLSIDPVKGLIVTMSGVELCINQEDGCKVTMESGVKFTIPLTSSESALKKKSA
ncbi:MAG: hypothetical protein H7281_03360 [Bacteriovorax sp.]|nr:hypothetical protein [Bacteriovorax sp.]